MKGLIRELSAIRAEMLRREAGAEAALRGLHEAYRESAKNLIHYMTLRRHDLREAQHRLAELGLSSLGGAGRRRRRPVMRCPYCLRHLRLLDGRHPTAPEAHHLVDTRAKRPTPGTIFAFPAFALLQVYLALTDPGAARTGTGRFLRPSSEGGSVNG